MIMMLLFRKESANTSGSTCSSPLKNFVYELLLTSPIVCHFRLFWVVCEMEDKWPDSSSFLRCCFQDLFETSGGILRMFSYYIAGKIYWTLLWIPYRTTYTHTHTCTHTLTHTFIYIYTRTYIFDNSAKSWITHKVNSYAVLNRFEFRVFLLLDWLLTKS